MTSKSVAPRRARPRLLPAALVAATWLATACGGAGSPDTPLADAAPDAAFESIDADAGAQLRTVSAADGDFAAADAAEPPVVVAESGEHAVPAGDDAAPDMQPQGSTPSYCERVPPIPSTTTTRWASAYGAHPDDNVDDTAALQKGLYALAEGETLALAPGRYLISKSLLIRKNGVTLRGDSGAILHGTNPEDQAVQIEANNVTVRNLTFTAITDKRRSAAKQSRIVIATPDVPAGPGQYKTTYNTTIRDNKIIESGAPGTPGQNSSSSGGILVIRADGFLIANNLVRRTLADGIHMTNGSRRGRVLNNTVQQTGDDMIAMVSYATSGTAALNSADGLLQDWDKRVDQRLDRRILVAGNKVGGMYWGRGISVVGGREITIVRNTVANVPLASAIILAREAHYQTFGVNNVIVEFNRIQDVQNLAPPFDPYGKYASNPRTGHGAIEVHASLFDDEARNSFLRNELSVRNVVARDNLLERIVPSGTRFGVAPPMKSMSATDSSGNLRTRYLERGDIKAQGVQRNGYNSTTGEPILIRSTTIATQGIQCGGNLRDGNTYQPGVCKLSPPTVTGAGLSCDSSGKLL
jgi:hypothetical protein